VNRCRANFAEFTLDPGVLCINMWWWEEVYCLAVDTQSSDSDTKFSDFQEITNFHLYHT
jgi:hypothetical protein